MKKEILPFTFSALMALSPGSSYANNNADVVTESNDIRMSKLIPCTEKSVKHIISIPQIHSTDLYTWLEDSAITGVNVIDLINNSQKKIYNLLKNIGYKVVFSEGITEENLKKSTINDIRLNRIRSTLSGDVGKYVDYMYLMELSIKRSNIELSKLLLQNFEYNYSLKKMKSPQEAEKKSSYESLIETEFFRGIYDKMDENNLFSEEIAKFRDFLEREIESYNKELEQFRRNSKQEREDLIRDNSYLAGGHLKLADEGKIKLVPGEDPKLNIKTLELLDNFKNKMLKLGKLSISLGLTNSEINKIFEGSLESEKIAKELGILQVYLDYIKAKTEYDSIQEAREDFVVDSIANYTGFESTIPVVYGAAHDFENNVYKYNEANPDNQMCLSEFDLGINIDGLKQNK